MITSKTKYYMGIKTAAYSSRYKAALYDIVRACKVIEDINAELFPKLEILLSHKEINGETKNTAIRIIEGFSSYGTKPTVRNSPFLANINTNPIQFDSNNYSAVIAASILDEMINSGEIIF